MRCRHDSRSRNPQSHSCGHRSGQRGYVGWAGWQDLQHRQQAICLSQAEPIAVMFYGAADFEGIPWETIVKEYRRKLSLYSYNTVDEHAQGFTNYLASLIDYIPARSQRESSRIRNTARSELGMIVSRINEESRDNPSYLTDNVLTDIVLDLIRSRISTLESSTDEPWFSVSEAAEACQPSY